MIEAKTKVQRYESYKDSGVEWLGDIPEHWELRRFKHFFKEKKITHNIELNCGSISFGKVVYKDDEKIPVSTKKSYQVLNKGEFLINPLNLNYDLKSLRIGLSDKDVVVSSGYIIIQNTSEISKNYYKWLLHIFDVAFMKTLGSGVRQTLSFTHIANSELVFPPLQEQTAIAQFLDDKTIKINEAISIKEQQIQLLKERKQILIHKAVTQGLNPNVQLKDSGVEWIGEIPEHWEVKKLKYLGVIFPGITGKAGEDFSKVKKVGFKPFIPFTSIFNNQTIDLSKHQYVNIGYNENQNKIIKGDILFLMSSETIDDIGKSSIYLGEEDELYLNSFCKGFRINVSSVNSEFVNHSLQSNSYRHYFCLKGRGFTRINIKQEFVLNILIPFPTLSEQKEISAYIETASEKIETAINLKQQGIAKLKEYKSSLINSVVTGKVKVC